MLNYKKIGNRVKNARKMQNMSQQKLAELVGYSTPHISHVETGNTKLSLECLVKIANALSMSADELLYDDLGISKQKETIFSEFQELLQGCNRNECEILFGVALELKKQLDKQGS